MTIFLAHPRAWSDDQVSEAVARLLGKYQAKQPPGSPPVEVVAGRADYQKRAAGLGGYQGWSQSLLSNTPVGKPRFTHFVVPGSTPQVGKATADIIQRVLRHPIPRKALLWDGEDRLQRIRGVQEVDAENWNSGWLLEVE